MPYPFNGQLKDNKVLNQGAVTIAMFNMIISQQVFDGNVASTELADRFRVDGTLFGDTKLFHSFDIGSPEDWTNDSEAPDLLKLNRNKSGKTQSIVMGVYKIIAITTDQYLSKQAFMSEGSFADYTSFLTSSLRKIKKVYDRSLINVKLGTMTPSTDRCKIELVTPLGSTTEETNRLEAQTLASELMILKADLEDNNRDFNSFNYLRSYSADDFIAVWNVRKHAKITKLDLPSIFHNEINADGGFTQYDLPEKWFGSPASSDLTLPQSAPSSVVNRILVSGWYKVYMGVGETEIELVSKPDSSSVFLWAGDAVPYKGQVYHDNVRNVDVSVTATTLPKEYYYVVDDTIAFVLVHKDSLPFMSGFETSSEFWNARSLTTNNYLIFGHNELEFLEEFPRIVVTVETEEPEPGPEGDTLL